MLEGEHGSRFLEGWWSMSSISGEEDGGSGRAVLGELWALFTQKRTQWLWLRPPCGLLLKPLNSYPSQPSLVSDCLLLTAATPATLGLSLVRKIPFGSLYSAWPRECPAHRCVCSVSRLLTADSNEKSIDSWIETGPLLEHVMNMCTPWILVFLHMCYKSMNIKHLFLDKIQFYW